MLTRPARPTPPAPPPPVEPETPAAGTRLATLYGEPLALVLQLQAAVEFGDASVLRERTRRLLRRAEHDAQDAGYDREDTREATFAVVAFLDETIQRSGWSDREPWLAQPLQFEMYERNDAGEEFFTRLDALRDRLTETGDVLEVYYLCLALGFRGRYEFLPPSEHRALVESVYSDLARTPGLAPAALAPHAQPTGRVVAAVRSRVPAWAVLATCGILCVIVYASLAVFARSGAGSTIDAIDRETAAAVADGPPAAAFGNAPADLLADTTEAAPEPDAPVDGFPPSDALPEAPPAADSADGPASADAAGEGDDDATADGAAPSTDAP